MFPIQTRIEPVVALNQLAASFYNSGLLLVVKHYYSKMGSSSDNSIDEGVEEAVLNFFLIYKLIMSLTPLLSAYILTKYGDRGYRRMPICVPLIGHLIARPLLLLVIFYNFPIEVMFAAAAINGITGYYTTYWAGVMTWALHASRESTRSLQLMIAEMVRGIAGLTVNLAFAWFFTYHNFTSAHGPVLVYSGIAFYVLTAMYSIIILRIPDPDEINIEDTDEQKPTQNSPNKLGKEQSTVIDSEHPENLPNEIWNSVPSTRIIVIMFISAILFNVASKGTEEIVNVFVQREPLNWDPSNAFFGKATAFLLNITSYLGLFILSKAANDLQLIAIGMLSFCSGVFIMAFARWTYLFFFARVVMMLSVIPMPTIRSAISKHSQGTSHGGIFLLFQLGIAIFASGSSVGFRTLYEVTTDWFPGFCFILSSVLGLLSLISIWFAKKYTDKAVSDDKSSLEEKVYKEKP